ncbi:MAG: hypothetical protein QXG05_01550 [Nitrososphaerota archaeon]
MSRNSGQSWKDISPNDGMRHGFAIGISGNDSVFVVPAYQDICKEHLSCIKGQLKVLRTDDDGKTWNETTKGLPRNVQTCVLRDSMAVDKGKPAKVFFGTITGEIYYSGNEGEDWRMLMKGAGRIQGISVLHAA